VVSDDPRVTARLASWHTLLDDGALQRGVPQLAATAPQPVVILGPGLAQRLGVRAGESVGVRNLRAEAGVHLDIVIAADLADDVAWVPTVFNGGSIYTFLGVVPGEPVVLDRFFPGADPVLDPAPDPMGGTP
jgi:NADH-quinone oxidoreductase subunit G